MKTVRVQRERPFCPHHLLLGAASCALEDAEAERDGYLYFQLTAITFSALALEAMANSFGNRLFSEWADYESSSPVAKIRLVCSHLGIKPDFNIEPWSSAKWIIKFRNKIAHAKPEMIVTDTQMTREEYEKSRKTYPESKIERDINLLNAKRSVKTVEDILSLWCENLPVDQLHGLLSDGWTGSASALSDT